MRILLIAPNTPDLNSTPEIRAITERHHAMVLNGTIYPATVDQYVRQGYTAIHFAGHSTSDFVELSGGTKLEADDLVRYTRMAGAILVFFNSCSAAKLAAYAVAHGVRYAIASTVQLEDDVAWEFPSAFYQALANGSWRDIMAAYREADSGDGEYALFIAPSIHGDYVQQVAELREKMKDTISISPRTVLLITMITLTALFVLAMVLIGLAGQLP